MSVAETSLQAYQNLDLTAKENEVLALFKSYGKPCTSLMLECHAFLIGSTCRRNTITGRFNSLEKKGLLKTKIGKCQLSKMSAKYYEIVKG